MPVYDYECQECSTKFELRRRFQDAFEARCPKCEGKAHRLFSPVPIIFNGSGFYVTDSRKNGSMPEEPKAPSCSPEEAE